MLIYKVLLLEDDPESAEIATRFLEKYNFHIDAVDDGRIGVVKVKTNRYDVIICDIMMPYVDGFAFLERTKDDLKGTPVIMLTALGDKESIIKASTYHVHGYLRKPISQDLIIEKVLSALRITLDKLIDRKGFPFEIKKDTALHGSVRLIFTGIPDKRSVNTIRIALKDISDHFPDTNELIVDVHEEFAYQSHSLKFIEELAVLAVKNLRIRQERLILSGSYFSRIGDEEIKNNQVLNQCTIKK